MSAIPQNVSLEDLMDEASYMLLSFNFKTRSAHFYKVDKGLPNNLCIEAMNSPRLEVPLNALLQHSQLYEQPTKKPVHFIWMTDYCMSSLYAKALNQVKRLYLYHETTLFSDLAIEKRAIDLGISSVSQEEWQKLLRIALRFQSKTFKSNDIALVKEWPHSNYILADILNVNESYRGIFLYGTLDEYLAQALKQQRRRELARVRVTNIFSDIKKLQPFEHVDFAKLTDSQAIAAHWLYLMYHYSQNKFSELSSLRTLNNRKLLRDASTTIQQSAKFYGLSVNKASANRITTGPVFKNHSKDAGKNFNIKKHRAALALNREAFSEEIAQGLDWAHTLMDAYPLPDKLSVDLFDEG